MSIHGKKKLLFSYWLAFILISDIGKYIYWIYFYCSSNYDCLSFRMSSLGCPRSAMLITGPHWCYIACIGNLLLSIKSAIPVDINVSIFQYILDIYIYIFDIGWTQNVFPSGRLGFPPLPPPFPPVTLIPQRLISRRNLLICFRGENILSN